MEYRPLGRTGVKVSQICLGTMMFGGRADKKESLRIIDYALDQGLNFVDTANVYAANESERRPRERARPAPAPAASDVTSEGEDNGPGATRALRAGRRP